MTTFSPVANFAKTSLTGTLAAGATSFSVVTGTGALFPNPAMLGAYNVVLWNSTDFPRSEDDTLKEIITVTGITADLFTVTRGQESTSDNNHIISGKLYKIALVVTAKTITDITTAATTLETTILLKAPIASPTFNGTVTLPSPFVLGATSVTTTGAQINYLNSASGLTGTGSVVLHTSPTLITPSLGAATATSINGNTFTTGTGTLTLSTFALTVSGAASISGTNTGDQTITLTGGVTGSGTGTFAATVITNANLTGPITSIGNATSIASQTGTGTTFVMSASPTLTGALTAAGRLILSGNQSFTAAVANAYMYHSDSLGLVMYGAGSSDDLHIANGEGGSIVKVITGTNKMSFFSTILSPAATTAIASMNAPHGVAPTSPVNGDIWTTTAGLYVRINGATVGPLS